MADDVDRASDTQAELEKRRLDEVRAAAAAPTPACEKCLWCGSKTVGHARWCGPECRDDWQRYGGEKC